MIQHAGDRALRAGTTLRESAGHRGARSARRPKIPLLLFTYLNPVLRYGLERLARDAKAAGIDGCLLTDASVEEAEEYVEVMRAAGLDTVFLAAPTSTERRLQLVARYSTGFIYLVSRTGVTGEQESHLRLGRCRWSKRCARSRICRWRWASASRSRSMSPQLARQVEAVVVGSAIVRHDRARYAATPDARTAIWKRSRAS